MDLGKPVRGEKKWGPKKGMKVFLRLGTVKLVGGQSTAQQRLYDSLKGVGTLPGLRGDEYFIADLNGTVEMREFWTVAAYFL